MYITLYYFFRGNVFNVPHQILLLAPLAFIVFRKPNLRLRDRNRERASALSHADYSNRQDIQPHNIPNIVFLAPKQYDSVCLLCRTSNMKRCALGLRRKHHKVLL